MTADDQTYARLNKSPCYSNESEATYEELKKPPNQNETRDYDYINVCSDFRRPDTTY